jgi:hypothetical protein
MQVTLTNLSGTDSFYISQLYRQLAPGESVTTRRTMAQIDADQPLKTLISNGSIGIVYTEETGDDIAGGGLEGGVAEQLTIRKAFTAGVAGTPDDVVIYTANAPYAFDIVDVTALVSTAIAATTLTLRDTAGGGGAALSDALSSAATGVKRQQLATGAVAVAKGGTVVIRRSDRGVAGEVLVSILRKS